MKHVQGEAMSHKDPLAHERDTQSITCLEDEFPPISLKGTPWRMGQPACSLSWAT